MGKGSFFSTKIYRDHIDILLSELGYSELVQRLFEKMTFFRVDPLLSCAMRRVWWGRVVTPMVSEMNLVMMWLVAEVRGPFQSIQSGGGLSVS